MNFRGLRLVLFCALAPATALPALDAGATAGTDPDTVAALAFLKGSYPDFSALNPQPGERLSDWAGRSRGRIEVLPAPNAVASAPPGTGPTTTLLATGDIYLRAGNFLPPEGWATFDARLRSLETSPDGGIVIDLRDTAAPEDFAPAAQLAGLLIPGGRPLFSMLAPGAPVAAYTSTNPIGGGKSMPLPVRPLAVLINGQTAGAGEALAASLKANGAVTFGRWTAGEGAPFATRQLPSGKTLHYQCGVVTLPDGTSLWRHAVEPDVGLLTDPKKEDATLALIAAGRVLDVIRESAGSHRLSEAALVRGEQPAIDAYLVPRGAPVAAGIPQDATLIAALDSLKAIRISRASTISTPATPPAVR